MAVSAWTMYSNGLLNIGNGNIDLAADTFFMILLTTSYTPAVNTDSTYGGINTNEVSTGNGYTAGGAEITGNSNTLSGATGKFTANDVAWTSATMTFRYAAIVHCANGSSLQSTDLLVGYSDTTGGGSNIVGGGTLSINPSASGIFTSTHSP